MQVEGALTVKNSLMATGTFQSSLTQERLCSMDVIYPPSRRAILGSGPLDVIHKALKKAEYLEPGSQMIKDAFKALDILRTQDKE